MASSDSASNSSADPRDYASLTASIETNLGQHSPLLSHREDIKDTLEWFLDLPHNRAQLDYFALILSIETHELAISKGLNIEPDGMQIKIEMVEGRRRCRASLMYVERADGHEKKHVILTGTEGENNNEATQKFKEEVEKLGQSMVAALVTAGVEERGEEVDDSKQGISMEEADE